MNQSCVERKGNREVRVSIGNRNLVVKEVDFLRSVESTAFHSSLGLGRILNEILFPQISLGNSFTYLLPAGRQYFISTGFMQSGFWESVGQGTRER